MGARRSAVLFVLVSGLVLAAPARSARPTPSLLSSEASVTAGRPASISVEGWGWRLPRSCNAKVRFSLVDASGSGIALAGQATVSRRGIFRTSVVIPGRVSAPGLARLLAATQDRRRACRLRAATPVRIVTPGATTPRPADPAGPGQPAGRGEPTATVAGTSPSASGAPPVASTPPSATPATSIPAGHTVVIPTPDDELLPITVAAKASVDGAGKLSFRGSGWDGRCASVVELLAGGVVVATVVPDQTGAFAVSLPWSGSAGTSFVARQTLCYGEGSDLVSGKIAS